MKHPKKKLPTGPTKDDLLARMMPHRSSGSPHTNGFNPEDAAPAPAEDPLPQPEISPQKPPEASDSALAEPIPAPIEDPPPDQPAPDLESFVSELALGADLGEPLQPFSQDLSTASHSSGAHESVGAEEGEFQPVVMTLSTEARQCLQQMQATTGVPYETLVDVLICHWDQLPSALRDDLLSQAYKIRVERLLSGQRKTIAMIERLLQEP
jgi:hypothetical protein